MTRLSRTSYLGLWFSLSVRRYADIFISHDAGSYFGPGLSCVYSYSRAPVLKESEAQISAKLDINQTIRNHNTTMENNRSALKNNFCIYYVVKSYSLQNRVLYSFHEQLVTSKCFLHIVCENNYMRINGCNAVAFLLKSISMSERARASAALLSHIEQLFWKIFSFATFSSMKRRTGEVSEETLGIPQHNTAARHRSHAGLTTRLRAAETQRAASVQ